MSAAFRPCAVVPTLDNPLTVRRVVEGIRSFDLDVFLIDDGSGPEGHKACAELAAEGLATVLHRSENGGKGAACIDGFRAAEAAGFTHAFQIDADCQHDLTQIPVLLEAARAEPEALVLGYPVYDDTVPRARRWGRRITSFWVAIEVGSKTKIRDAMVGFRVYPLQSTLAIGRIGRGMDFDIEVAVRLVLAGTPTINLPVGVNYLAPEEGGVSHFRMIRDNVSFSLLHARLCTAGIFRWLGRLVLGGAR